MIVVMQMNMVEVEISDARRYTQVVALVDRNDFLDDICSIRERLQITSYPYVVGKYADVEANNLAQAYKKGLMTISEFFLALKELCLEKNFAFMNVDKTLALANMYAESLVTKYHRSRSCVPVVLAALLCNKVSDFDFRVTDIFRLNPESIKLLDQDLNSGLVSGDEMITIVVTAESTQNEVVDRFKHIQKYIFKSEKRGIDQTTLGLYQDESTDIHLNDTKNHIKRDRSWFWQKRMGNTYEQIWESIDEDEVAKGYDCERVTKAVRAYAKLVEQEV